MRYHRILWAVVLAIATCMAGCRHPDEPERHSVEEGGLHITGIGASIRPGEPIILTATGIDTVVALPDAVLYSNRVELLPVLVERDQGRIVIATSSRSRSGRIVLHGNDGAILVDTTLHVYGDDVVVPSWGIPTTARCHGIIERYALKRIFPWMDGLFVKEGSALHRLEPHPVRPDYYALPFVYGEIELVLYDPAEALYHAIRPFVHIPQPDVVVPYSYTDVALTINGIAVAGDEKMTVTLVRGSRRISARAQRTSDSSISMQFANLDPGTYDVEVESGSERGTIATVSIQNGHPVSGTGTFMMNLFVEGDFEVHWRINPSSHEADVTHGKYLWSPITFWIQSNGVNDGDTVRITGHHESVKLTGWFVNKGDRASLQLKIIDHASGGMDWATGTLLVNLEDVPIRYTEKGDVMIDVEGRDLVADKELSYYYEAGRSAGRSGFTSFRWIAGCLNPLSSRLHLGFLR